MSDCLFCKIIAGEIPSTCIYEDEAVYAFMDINPLNPGHCLVVPKMHGVGLGDIDGPTGGAVFQAAMKIARALRASDIQTDGINLHLADGKAAGQEVFHVHLHIIPRTDDDELGLKHPEGYPQQADFDELKTTADKIKGLL